MELDLTFLARTETIVTPAIEEMFASLFSTLVVNSRIDIPDFTYFFISATLLSVLLLIKCTHRQGKYLMGYIEARVKFLGSTKS